MTGFANDADTVDRIFDHIDNKTTDIGEEVWQEPVENYRSQERFDAEIELLRKLPVAFCPSSALPEAGSWIARTAALTPLLVVRGRDGVVRAFRNACRHRGMAVAKDSGCARTFVCPYHSWTYDLEGRLVHMPGEDGFPGLDQDDYGLVPVRAEEKNGLVFITQDEPVSRGALDYVPDLISPEQKVFNTLEFTDQANWKLIGETSMEGYHIKSLHKTTFFPYGFDNLNIVETSGPNSRIVFPFRRVEKMRDVPREERTLDGLVTDVYQLFPNTHISVLSSHSVMVVLEPLTPDSCQWIIYQMSNHETEAGSPAEEKVRKDASFVQDSGLMEDRDAACSIQAGLDSRANSHFIFGKHEKAIVHFHKHLDDMLSRLD